MYYLESGNQIVLQNMLTLKEFTDNDRFRSRFTK